MDKAIIIGAGTYGQVYSEYLKNIYSILGFLDDDIKKTNSKVNGYMVLGTTSKLKDYDNKESISIFAPLGDNLLRKEILLNASLLGYKTPSFIHPSVFFDKSLIYNSPIYILSNTNFMPFCKIGQYCMISMGVNIAHHVILEEACFISQGCNIGASITIEKKSFIGIGSTLMTGVTKIGQNSIIGAGTVVIRDIEEFSIVVGNPGRIIKKVKNK